jgi:ribosomal-protein-alanine N-acetyltransferase
MEIPTLETARLVLRPFAESDAGPLCRILSEKGILRYFPNPEAPPLDKVQRLVARQLEHWAEHGLGWWAVEARQDPELIGWCGLQFLPELEEVEVGYLLSRAYWGQGLTTEAAFASVQHGFERLELAKIVALAHPENGASRRVAEKLGMRLVGPILLWGLDLCRYEVDRGSFGEGDQIESVESPLEGLGRDVDSHPNSDTAAHVPST